MAEPTSILGRRDVPLVACASVAGVSALGAVSALLQPGQSAAETTRMVALCVLLAAIASGLMLALDLPLAIRWRGRVRSSLVACALVMGALTAVALSARGLSSVSFTGVVLISTYAALILPRGPSRLTLAGLIGLELLIEALTPATRPVDAVAIVAVTVAGWVVGGLGNRAHGRAARLALVLSRTDQLTATLNRRGFFEAFEAGLQAATSAGDPFSLLVLDLDGFKAVNDAHGAAAGDALLGWVGRRLAAILPEGASAGRLGGDEFAVALPGLDQAAADIVAVRVASALGERIGVSVGCAAHEPALTTPRDADDLVRIADAELYAVKHGLDVHHPALETTSRRTTATTRDGRRVPMPEPILRYADLVQTGGAPMAPAAGVRFGWLTRAACLVAGGAGGIIGAVQLAQGGTTAYDEILRFALVPWVLAILGLGLLNSEPRGSAGLWRGVVVPWTPTVLLGAGISVILMAGHGIDGALVGGLALKVMFDAFVLPPRRAFGTLLVMLACWAGVAVFGPADALWAAPLQFGIFLAAFAISATAHRAYADATRRSLSLTHTDPLTGLLNRTGLEAVFHAAPGQAAAQGRHLAIVLFDLNDLSAVNDRHGHAAGDEILVAVAAATRAALPGAYGIGRIGGDEFVAAVPVGAAHESAALEARVRAALEPLIGISLGSAVMPGDGVDIAALMGVADRRSYERKAASAEAG